MEIARRRRQRAQPARQVGDPPHDHVQHLALQLQFQVVAKLASDPRLQVQFETSIDGNGQIRLKD